MAHVHGEKTVASQMKPVVNAGTAKMMGSMMKMSEGMAQVMKHSKTPRVATGVATGAVISAGSSVGKSVIGRFLTHPLVLFGLGVAASYYLHKYRKSILSAFD
jgi:hypothetical protein